MTTLFRWLVRIAFAVIVLLALVFVGARFHDGPLGPIPGGALVSGEVVGQPVVDWSFARDIPEVELQLATENGSRTVWMLVDEGRAYVPCALGFPPGKRWYKEAVKDGRATLRVEGRRYPVTLTKTDDPALAERMRAEVQRKYKTAPPGEGGGVWIFQVASRAPDGAVSAH
ncbi:MAG TPA: DUF2255 family protein [Myxococcota bacterium]|jgi:hypothetical protein|nr:DUF2255 family protein [Myxococcota bacterium]